MPPPLVTEAEFKAAMASFASGVTIVTSVDAEGQPFGLTATAFSSVAKSPPRCLVCVSHAAEAHPVIVLQRRFAVNILSRDNERLSQRFATHGIDKFTGIEWIPGAATGCPILPAALAAVECTAESVFTVSDHDIVVGLVHSARVDEEEEPLVYFRGRYAAIISK